MAVERVGGRAVARPMVGLAPLLRALRPLQWAKNAVVLAGVVFGLRLTDPTAVAQALLAVVAFCAVSSAVYLLNDVVDLQGDRAHPEKRLRPLAAGELGVGTALGTAALLLAGSLALAWTVRPPLAGVVAAYAALMVVYCLGLKRFVIVDVMAIAAGFVLRAVAGAVAVDVSISPWLLVCTSVLALLLGFGKRRHELASLPDAPAHRRNLDQYSLPLLDQLVSVAAGATVASYVLYAVEARRIGGTPLVALTVPVVVYAVFRYLYLLQRGGGAGSPETMLVTDRPLLAAVVAWGALCVALLYL